jgi:hypothetical protein
LHIPAILAHLSSGLIIGICVAAAIMAAGAWLGIAAWKRSRINPEEVERRRRAALKATGKMGDATLLEMRENHIFYCYDVRGVEYTASQDVSALAAMLPPDPAAVNGVVYVKYDARNPANSMILCEEWSGLRNLRVVQ